MALIHPEVAALQRPPSYLMLIVSVWHLDPALPAPNTLDQGQMFVGSTPEAAQPPVEINWDGTVVSDICW